MMVPVPMCAGPPGDAVGQWWTNRGAVGTAGPGFQQ